MKITVAKCVKKYKYKGFTISIYKSTRYGETLYKYKLFPYNKHTVRLVKKLKYFNTSSLNIIGISYNLNLKSNMLYAEQHVNEINSPFWLKLGL